MEEYNKVLKIMIIALFKQEAQDLNGHLTNLALVKDAQQPTNGIISLSNAGAHKVFCFSYKS